MNRPRHSGRKGHVESWFFRANDPASPRAFWLKATILVPLGAAPVAELWCVAFDGDRRWGGRRTVPLAEARFDEGGIELAGARFAFAGSAAGALGPCAWELRWTPEDFAPLCLFPSPRMLDSGFPRSKLLTPVPAARFSGSFRWGDQVWDTTGWRGMQGHNWGREHTWEYAWGQVLFPDASGATAVMVEGYSARVKLGPVLLPRLSAMVVQRGPRIFRFDRTFDPWRQRVELGDLAWSVQLRGPDGEASLDLVASAARTACLRYDNPDGFPSYCYNSKLARAELRVVPVNDDPFTCVSEHGGALELLRRAPDPRWPDPV